MTVIFTMDFAKLNRASRKRTTFAATCRAGHDPVEIRSDRLHREEKADLDDIAQDGDHEHDEENGERNFHEPAHESGHESPIQRSGLAAMEKKYVSI